MNPNSSKTDHKVHAGKLYLELSRNRYCFHESCNEELLLVVSVDYVECRSSFYPQDISFA